MAEDVVTIYDEQGQKQEVPRARWVEEWLPRNLKAAWDDADALYAVILGGLKEKAAAGVLAAIDRLAEIDPSPERVAVTRGIALIQLDRPDEAEAVFLSFAREHGETGAVLTNLAKIYADRNDDDKAAQTLKRALLIDPNLDHGLGWYAGLAHRRGGESAVSDVLRQVAEHPKSWRAQLWLVRDLVEARKFDEACDVYRRTLETRKVPGEGLVQITGELGKAGQIRQLVDLVAPYYSLEEHGPYAGLNLLQGMIATNRFVEATTLLHQLHSMKDPRLAQFLADAGRRIASAAGAGDSIPVVEGKSVSVSRAAPAAPAASADADPDAEAVQIAAVPLLNPIWTAALSKPDWLVPPPTAGALKVGFFSLADGRPDAEDEVQNPDHPVGRLTRNFPMYLAEALRLRGCCATLCMLPVAPEIGPVVARAPWPLQHMMASCPAEFVPDVVVCGAITQGSRGPKVELHLFRTSDKSAIRTLRIPLNADFSGGFEKAVQDLTSTLVPLGGKAGPLPDGWEMAGIDDYVKGLGHLFVQTLAASKIIPIRRVPDEKGMLESYFELAEAERQSPLPLLVALAGVVASRKYGSANFPAYGARLKTMLPDAAARLVVIRQIAPMAYRHLADLPAYQQAVEDVKPFTNNADYAAWIQAIAP